MQYKIVEAASVETLVAQVNEAIAGGWEPVGGVSAASAHGTHWTFRQAMTLEM